MDTWAPVLPSVRIGIPVAETSGAATAPSAAVPRKSRREIAMDPPLARLSRIRYQVKHHRAAMGACPVLEDIDALPRPERHAALLHRDRNLSQCQRGADVRRHIIGPFGGVAVQPVIFRSNAAEELI